MAKIRIKDLATELGVIYADLASRANVEFGIEVTGPMTLIDEEVADQLRAWNEKRTDKFKIEEKRVAKRVIRRRRVKRDEPVEPKVEAEAAEPEQTAAAAEKSAQPTEPVEDKVEATPKEKAPSPSDRPRKKSFQALKVVEERAIKAPEVKDAPVFAAEPAPEEVAKPEPERKDEVKPPEVIAREEAEREAKRKSPAAKEESSRTLGRREVIEVHQMVRPKQFGRKKIATKKGKKTEITTPKASKRVIKISDTITIGELAKRMAVKVGEVISKAVSLGLMVNINQSVDAETAAILASDFGYEIENTAVAADEILVEQEEQVGEKQPRPPVITVMGHVDHGKTSLLDYIRKANVTDAEHGGITQHIGAYHVSHKKGDMVFLDTPGHEAFTAMRARGTSVTDVVVLVVAADDGVMPQTRESVNHAKAANAPIIIAVNKIDKPEAKPERVRQELTELELVPEDWGGDTIFVSVSAKTGQGIDELLDMIMLQAEVMELKADANRLAKGTIIEAKLDRGRGAVATVLVQEGTLKVGDPVVCGMQAGKVRTLVDDRGRRVKQAGPSVPVEVVGLSGVVEVGDELVAVKDEKKARQVGDIRQQMQRQKELERSGKMRLEDLKRQIEQDEVQALRIVLKGDVVGSIEAVCESLSKQGNEKVGCTVLHSAVGGITESDVMLASASQALVVGFNVRPEAAIQQLAEREGVEIRLYNVIYDLVNDVKKAMAGLLEPTRVETVAGHVEIKQTFHISKIGTIGGGVVTDGKIQRSHQVRLLRDSVIVYEGKLASLKRFKDDVKEVKNGLECGLSIENFNDIKVGDVVEAFEIEQIQQEL